MGERKVLNKYIPPDFDPSLVPRGKKLSSKDGTVPVRMMLPFSIQCATCHTFLYRGRKFNSKKEAMSGPSGTYLGMTRWRFYIKCTTCARPITFLTDPANADYEMESGGTRNYEMTRDPKMTSDHGDDDEQDSSDDNGDPKSKTKKTKDPLQALEERVLDSQREMATLDQLEEIKAMNARHAQFLSLQHVGGTGTATDSAVAAVLRAIHSKNNMTNDDTKQGNNRTVELDEQDEELIRSIQFGKQQQPAQQSKSASNHIIRRLDDVDEADWELQRQQQQKQAAVMDMATSTATASKPFLPLTRVIAKRKPQQKYQQQQQPLSDTERLGSETGPYRESVMKRPLAGSFDDAAKDESQEKVDHHDGNVHEPDTKKQRPIEDSPTTTATATATMGLSNLLGGYGSSSDEASS